MKGKFWSLCAALVLCLVLLPATAHAADHVHPVCGAACDGDCDGGHTSVNWEPFSAADDDFFAKGIKSRRSKADFAPTCVTDTI